MREKYLLSALLCVMVFAGLFGLNNTPLFIADAQGSSTLAIAPSGAFANGIILSDLSGPTPEEQSSTWTWSETNDFITFRDSSTTDGFRIRLYLSSSDNGAFVYSGSSVSQENIMAEYFSVYGGYNIGTGAYSAPTKGVDDSTTTLNLDSSVTCSASLDLNYYDFHSHLNSATMDYGLSMITSQPVTYFTSSATCETEGTVDIRRMKLNYYKGANSGDYTSTLVVIILDGTT